MTADEAPPQPAPEERNGADRLRTAVAVARRAHGVPVTLPLVGAVDLPTGDELAFITGIGALAVVGVLEWPVALVLVVGRVLSHSYRSRSLEALGDALEHA